jgi:phosphatidylglycerophosphatase C
MTQASGLTGGEKPCVAIFDLDGTVTSKGTYTPFILSIARRQRWRYIYALPLLIAAVLYKARILSRATLKELMLKAAVGGISRDALRTQVGEFVERCLERDIRPGAIRAIEWHKAAGDRLILATASFAFYAEDLGRQLGFDNVVATGVRWHDDHLTCKIDGENCRGTVKLMSIKANLPDLKENYRVIAYSDHHVDLPLLRWADSGVAVNPTRRLRRAAEGSDLTVVDWNVA